MADPKDKKIAALAGKVEELQAILPSVNDIKAQLEERKAACRALKTQVDRAKAENKRLSERVGELEGKKGVSAGGGSATVKGLRLQVLKLEKSNKILEHQLIAASAERTSAASAAEAETRRLQSIIEGHKDNDARLRRQIAELKEQNAGLMSSMEAAAAMAEEEAAFAAEAFSAGDQVEAAAGDDDDAWGARVAAATAAASGTTADESAPLESAPSLPVGTDASAPPTPARLLPSGGSNTSELLSAPATPRSPSLRVPPAGGRSLKGRIQQLEAELAAAAGAYAALEREAKLNAASARRAGVLEGAERYAAAPLVQPAGDPLDGDAARWTSLLVDAAGAVRTLPAAIPDEDVDLAHCAETDVCLELTVERAEVAPGKNTAGGETPTFEVRVDVGAAVAEGSHEPIELVRVGTASPRGGASVVNVGAQLHIVVPVTRETLRRLLSRPLRVELRAKPSRAASEEDDEDVDTGSEGSNEEGSEDTAVGLVHLGDMLRDEYPETFGALGRVGPRRGAMFGTPAPPLCVVPLFRGGGFVSPDSTPSKSTAFASAPSQAPDGGTYAGSVDVRARFRRSAAGVLALFHEMNGALEAFEVNPRAIAAASGTEPLVVMLAWGSAKVQAALGAAHRSVGRLLRGILEDGVVDAEEMSALEATLGTMEAEVGAAVAEAGTVTVDGLKRVRARGGFGIGRAERDTLGEAVAALRRAVTATVSTFQAELTDVINRNAQGARAVGIRRGTTQPPDQRNRAALEGHMSSEDEEDGGPPRGDGLGEVAVRLSATGARLQKEVKRFEATVRVELDKQATELESTLAESTARVRAALEPLEAALAAAGRLAVTSGRLDRAASDRAQRAVAAADRAVTGAVRMCKPVALRAALDTLGRRGGAASSNASDSAAVSAALRAARAVVRRAGASALCALTDARGSVPAGTGNGLLPIRRELLRVVHGWVALMADINAGVAAAAAGEGGGEGEGDRSEGDDRKKMAGDAAALSGVAAGLVVRVNAAAGSLRASAIAAREDIVGVLGAVGAGKLSDPAGEILGVEAHALTHPRLGLPARAFDALRAIEAGVFEAVGSSEEGFSTPLSDESRETVWSAVEARAAEAWAELTRVVAEVEDVLNGFHGLNGVFGGGLGSILAEQEDAAAAEGGQRAVVETLAVREAFDRVVANVRSAAAAEAVALADREREEKAEDGENGDSECITTPGATVADRLRLRLNLLGACFGAPAASLPAVFALYAVTCVHPARSLPAATVLAKKEADLGTGQHAQRKALAGIERLYVGTLGGSDVDFRDVLNLRARREDCGVLPGVGPVAGAVATLRTATHRAVSSIARRLAELGEQLRGPGGALYVFHEPIGTSAALGGAAASVWPPVYPHGPAHGPPSVGHGGPPDTRDKYQLPPPARLLFVSTAIRAPRLLVEAAAPGTTAVVFDPEGLEEPGGIRRLLLAAEGVLGGCTVGHAALATTGRYVEGGGFVGGGYLTAAGDEDVMSFWKTASREVFGRQGTWHFVCDGNVGGGNGDEEEEESQAATGRDRDLMATWGKATRTSMVAGRIDAACDPPTRADSSEGVVPGAGFFSPERLAVWSREALAATLAEREEARRVAAGLAAREAEDQAMMAEREAARELAARETTYVVTVETGTAQGAGTTSGVFLSLQGHRRAERDCVTREVLLAKGGSEKPEKRSSTPEMLPETDAEAQETRLDSTATYFTPGGVDVFEVTLEYIDELVAVHIFTDGEGPRPGWQLKRLTVSHSIAAAAGASSWSRACEPINVWLAKDAADGAVARTLTPVPTASTDHKDKHSEVGRPPRAARAKYTVGVYTADVHAAGTTSAVALAVEGTSGTLRCSPPGGGSPPDRGEGCYFPVEGAIGRPKEVVVTHDGTGSDPTWCPGFVVIATERVAALEFFPVPPGEDGCSLWIHPGEGTNEGEGRKAPNKIAVRPAKAPAAAEVFAALAAIGPDAFARTYDDALVFARSPAGDAALVSRTDGCGMGVLAIERFVRAVFPGLSADAEAYVVAMLLPSWKPKDLEETSPPAMARLVAAIAECHAAERIAAAVVGVARDASPSEARKAWEHIVESSNAAVKRSATEIAEGVAAWRRVAPRSADQGVGAEVAAADRPTAPRLQRAYASLRPDASALELRLLAALSQNLRRPTPESPRPTSAAIRSALELVPRRDDLEGVDGAAALASAAKTEEEMRAAAEERVRAREAAIAASLEEEAARRLAAKRRADAGGSGAFEVYISDVTSDSSDEDDERSEERRARRAAMTRRGTRGRSRSLAVPSGDGLSDSDPDSPRRPPTPRSSIARRDDETGDTNPKGLLVQVSGGGEPRGQEDLGDDETESEDEGSPGRLPQPPPPPPLPAHDDDGVSTASEEESDSEPEPES